MLTRQNQGSLGASYWRMTSQDDRLPRGVSICLVVVVCATSVTDASAVEASAVGMSVIYVCFPSFTVGCGALRGVRVGVLHYTGVRHAGDTPSEGFV